MLTKTILTLLLFSAFTIPGNPAAVSVIDFVKIKNDKKAEALYFYNNNWKVYREIALKKGYISSYKMMTVQPGKTGYDIILVTTYKDSIQFKNSEANFATIIKSERPGGPKLLNETKPVDFREAVSSATADEIASD